MKNINMYCPINGTGYGITSKNIVSSLSKSTDATVSLFPIGYQVQLETSDEESILKPCLENSKFYNPFSPCLKIWHQHDLASRIGKGIYGVFPFFESDRLYEFEIHQLNSADYVFTASKWGKTVLEKNGVNSYITVAPLGVNLDIFKQEKIERENDTYVFCHIGKWEKRKSQDFLIEAFNKAFTEKDNVELWLLPHNPFLNKEETEKWTSLVDNSKLKEKIKVYDRLQTQYHVASFINHSDCGVFLSRAEGWNNEIPEVMAMNKPVIATNYSAHTEYCTSDNAFLVDIDKNEPAKDDKWFNGHGNWAKLEEKQLEQTVEHMRFVYNNNIRTNPNGVETAKLYSWDNTASVIYQTLLENDSYNVK